MNGLDPVSAAAPGTASAEQRLRQMAVELEGVFYAQLFQAMREAGTVVGEDDSSAEQLFTAMLDQETARMAAGQGSRGLADAMYRQLSQQLRDAPTGGAEPDPGALRGSGS